MSEKTAQELEYEIYELTQKLNEKKKETNNNISWRASERIPRFFVCLSKIP
jgi:hypothetical protein